MKIEVSIINDNFVNLSKEQKDTLLKKVKKDFKVSKSFKMRPTSVEGIFKIKAKKNIYMFVKSIRDKDIIQIVEMTKTTKKKYKSSLG